MLWLIMTHIFFPRKTCNSAKMKRKERSFRRNSVDIFPLGRKKLLAPKKREGRFVRFGYRRKCASRIELREFHIRQLLPVFLGRFSRDQLARRTWKTRNFGGAASFCRVFFTYIRLQVARIYDRHFAWSSAACSSSSLVSGTVE